MAESAPVAPLAPPQRRFGLRDLSRVATWGLAALGAVTLAVYAASSRVGEERLVLAVAAVRGLPPPERLARTPAETETRKLAETVRELNADREQLLARLDSLERNVGDITGSIARIAAQPPPPEPAPAPAAPAMPGWVSVPPPLLSAPEARPEPAAEETAGEKPKSEPKSEPRAEFGVDLGRATTVEGLRQLWNAARAKHGAALDGLRPIVTVREIARSGGVELRLVAGPMPNAAAAARLCASLPATTCHPTAFDGQRLALR